MKIEGKYRLNQRGTERWRKVILHRASRLSLKCNNKSRDKSRLENNRKVNMTTQVLPASQSNPAQGLNNRIVDQNDNSVASGNEGVNVDEIYAKGLPDVYVDNVVEIVDNDGSVVRNDKNNENPEIIQPATVGINDNPGLKLTLLLGFQVSYEKVRIVVSALFLPSVTKGVNGRTNGHTGFSHIVSSPHPQSSCTALPHSIRVDNVRALRAVTRAVCG